MKKSSYLLFVFLAWHSVLAAQTAPPTQPASAAAPASAPAAAPAASNNATEIDSSTSTALDYLFNHKAGEGTTMKAGNEVASALADKIKAIDVLKTPGLDNPEVRARFETYLSLKEVPQARIDEYFGKMQLVSDTLKAGDAFGAWKILYSLGDYQDLDAGISRELAHRVEAFWNTDRTKNGLEMANTQLRNNIDTYNHNADLDAQDLHDQEIEDAQKLGKSGGSKSSSSGNSSATNSTILNVDADPAAAEAAVMPTMGGALQNKMEMTTEYLNAMEARFKIYTNEVKENKITDEDRMDFADYIQTLYRSHRYYHVIIAADFYRALFNEGDYPSDLSNQAVAGAGSNARTASDSAHVAVKSLGLNASGPVSAFNQLGGAVGGDNLGQASQSDQPLSIADEVTSALEINNRVSQAVEVFKYKAQQGDIASAADELQEAFVGNEFHPALQGLAREDKQKVGDFLAKLDVLKNQLEVRDFEQVEGQVAAIQKIASDFDSTKPMALVNAIKLESRLRLGKARLLAQGGDLTNAMEEFQTAAEEWPGNPDLTTSANLFFKSENNQNQSTSDFDRLLQDQNFRGIFDRQLEFALAVKGDSTREKQLKDVLEKVGKAKMAAEKANALMMNGDVDGAWETIDLALKDWPDDTNLNKLLADLSGRSADFVSALNKARDAESKKEYGYSLTWYVNAQNYYPPSVIANDGINRVSRQILSPQSSLPAAETN
ncbi:MAG: hypothetical protein LV480_04260 [Methylacidiphilales bacterium]|nr:hypothetical protein [Candidatus Methylacidiphilales bacterium]